MRITENGCIIVLNHKYYCTLIQPNRAPAPPQAAADKKQRAARRPSHSCGYDTWREPDPFWISFPLFVCGSSQPPPNRSTAHDRCLVPFAFLAHGLVCSGPFAQRRITGRMKIKPYQPSFSLSPFRFCLFSRSLTTQTIPSAQPARSLSPGPLVSCPLGSSAHSPAAYCLVASAFCLVPSALSPCLPVLLSPCLLVTCLSLACVPISRKTHDYRAIDKLGYQFFPVLLTSIPKRPV